VTILFNKSYETDFSKKQNAKKFEDTHTLKIFRKVIHHRIYKKLKENIADTQFGFRNGSGTKEALFVYNVLM